MPSLARPADLIEVELCLAPGGSRREHLGGGGVVNFEVAVTCGFSFCLTDNRQKTVGFTSSLHSYHETSSHALPTS